MKKMMMIMAMMVTIATHAAAMPYNEAKAEALFLTDKMAYELNLDDRQYEAVYEINLDYFAGLSRHDLFGSDWSLRNSRLRHVLNGWQYDRYMAANYFFRPVSWTNNHWHFGIYGRYADRNHFYRPRPNVVAHHGHGPGRVGATPPPPAHNNHGNGHVGTKPRPHNTHTTTTPHNTHTSTGRNSWHR